MKTKFLAAAVDIVAFLVIFFTDLQGALFAIGFLIMTDTFTGIWASKKVGGWKSVTSRKAGRIISKFILYPLALIVAKVAEQYLSPAIPWTDVTAGILAVVEVKSIFENMSSILGFELWSKVKSLLWPDKPEDKPEDKK